MTEYRLRANLGKERHEPGRKGKGEGTDKWCKEKKKKQEKDRGREEDIILESTEHEIEEMAHQR